MFGRLGPMELILVLAIALVIFGPKKLPEIGRALGSAIKNFKKGTKQLTEDLDTDLDDNDTVSAKSTVKAEKTAQETDATSSNGKSKKSTESA